MNITLVNNRPEGCTKEEFLKMWDNAGYTLEALQKTLEKWKQEASVIKMNDFDCPNHYARLMFEQGQVKAYEAVLALMPESLKV